MPMTSYLSPQFGFCVPVFAHPGPSFFRAPAWTALDPAAAVEAALLAEELGYDSLWIADHLIHGRDGAILEGWSTLAFLAGRTRRIRLGTIHLAHLFRSPALTAKMAATLDTLSDGRLIFFYDVGGLGPEANAYGYPALSWPERIARFDEALGLIRQLWTTKEPLSFLGKYYQTDRAICRPAPRQQPMPPIWLGEVREDPWSDVVCKHATGWNSTPATVDGYREKLTRLDAAVRRAGRDLASFEQSLEIEVLIAPDRASVRALADRIAALPAAGPVKPRTDLVDFLQQSDPRCDWRLPGSFEDRALVGTPDEVVDRIREYQALGVRHFMLWFLDFPSTTGLKLFAEKVMPALR
jgi:alkanesulfonate monooxygenase SsuD/methylene tetrahydromethanopterin reductase-like flavin-dependent oxidoreductase (luciferase family)